MGKSALTMPTKLVSHFSWLPFAISVCVCVMLPMPPSPPPPPLLSIAAVVPNVILAYVLHLNFAHRHKQSTCMLLCCVCLVVQSTRFESRPVSFNVMCLCLCMCEISLPHSICMILMI